ncbi:E3 binding domain-containing protein [Streptomyces sp. NPDC054794]
MAEFTMPSLGADMDEGLLQEWLVGPGDPVHKGDVVAVVETDKAAIEVECFESGTVGRLLVQPGTRVPVGTPLAVIEGEGAPSTRAGAPGRPEVDREPAAKPEHAKPRRKAQHEPKSVQKPARTGSRTEPAGQPARTSATPTQLPPMLEAEATSTIGTGPLVRHLALQRGVDLTAVHGTGRGGRITRADVQRAAPAPGPRVRATPYARRLARDLGIDLTTVRGTASARSSSGPGPRAACSVSVRW